jgi:hypothetical protein
MPSRVSRGFRGLAAGCVSGLAIVWSSSACAQDTQGDAARLKRLEEAIASQTERLDQQQKELDRQQEELLRQHAELRTQLAELASLRQSQSVIVAAPIRNDDLAPLRAGRTNQQGATAPTAPQTSQRPVGVAPPDKPAPQLVALPEGVGVLTPKGRLVIDPSFEYINSSSNRLVFRGVEIVTGVQIGLIEASDVDRNSLIGSLAARFGISDRIEIEARIPYVYRNDEITTLAQQNSTITQTTELEGHDIGDVEVTGRYQFNRGRNGGPIFVGNLRYKSDTGTGPFDVERDVAGIARELPTGSGFWGLEPSITALLPSDPAVLFATLGYLYHAPDEVNRTINGVAVGEVDPGDSINASLGFGFAVNQRFSFSAGYRHSYIFPTETELGATRQESDDLHAGSLQLGLSYRFGERTTVNTNFEFGATEDAPDVRAVVRIPFAG